MAKNKRTKSQKCADYFDAFECIRTGKPVKRSGRKDGGIQTKPAVPVPPLAEKDVLKECIEKLRELGLKCDRNNTGFGDIHGTGGKFRYGIAGGGDIIGLTKSGRHFEVECKKGIGGILSLAQQRRKKDIEMNNGLYLIVHGVEELLVFMRRLK